MNLARALPRDPPIGATASPFLKWAGGKRQLLPQIRRFYPTDFSEYAEPFLGSGAVFFDLASRGLLRGRRVLLMDTNQDLIECYAAVRDDVERVIALLKDLEKGHRAGGSQFFYAVRDQQFNPMRRDTGRVDGVLKVDPALAATLIYLNRTCFNGLFRLNSKGDFNTPAGRYANPMICDSSNLRGVSRILNEGSVELRQSDFMSARDLDTGAFVYFDPPYAPLSKTANFTSYTAGGFSEDHQRRLQKLVVELAAKGAYVLLSNSVAPLTTKLYETSRAVGRVGLKAHRVPARRAINCDGSSRGTVDEYLISNVPQSGPHGG